MGPGDEDKASLPRHLGRRRDINTPTDVKQVEHHIVLKAAEQGSLHVRSYGIGAEYLEFDDTRFQCLLPTYVPRWQIVPVFAASYCIAVSIYSRCTRRTSTRIDLTHFTVFKVSPALSSPNACYLLLERKILKRTMLSQPGDYVTTNHHYYSFNCCTGQLQIIAMISFVENVSHLRECRTPADCIAILAASVSPRQSDSGTLQNLISSWCMHESTGRSGEDCSTGNKWYPTPSKNHSKLSRSLGEKQPLNYQDLKLNWSKSHTTN